MLKSNEDTNWEIDVLRLYVAPTILVLVLWLVMDFGRCQYLGGQNLVTKWRRENWHCSKNIGTYISRLKDQECLDLS
ncbi:hypothetical protein SLA2020_298540 [Shorea laevis]